MTTTYRSVFGHRSAGVIVAGFLSVYFFCIVSLIDCHGNALTTKDVKLIDANAHGNRCEILKNLTQGRRRDDGVLLVLKRRKSALKFSEPFLRR